MPRDILANRAIGMLGQLIQSFSLRANPGRAAGAAARRTQFARCACWHLFPSLYAAPGRNVASCWLLRHHPLGDEESCPKPRPFLGSNPYVLTICWANRIMFRAWC